MTMEENTAAEIPEDFNAEDAREISADWYGPAPGGKPHGDSGDAGDADQHGLADPWDDGHETETPEKEERFTLKHLGREFDVSREELITLAQKGRDYDRIRARADALAAAQNPDCGIPAHDEYCSRRDHELADFVSEYGGVAPEDIPAEVWSEVVGGKPLLTAYQAYENRVLKRRLMADMQNQENRLRSTGSRATAGKTRERGELESDWYGD